MENQPIPPPLFPYDDGQKFVAKRHIPPLPINSDYKNRVGLAQDNLQHLTLVEHCRLHPPSEGITKGDDTFSFTVTKQLRGLPARGAHIVVVNEDMVAKIYDPYYYEWFNDFGTKEAVGVHADEDYRREVAAYEALSSSSLSGNAIPHYYGSWTIDVTTDSREGPLARSVRLILIEYIRGRRLYDFDPSSLRDSHRDNIIVKAINAESLILYNGVNHGDFHPQNIMCCGNNYASPGLRVCIIDFNHSTVSRIEGEDPPPWFEGNRMHSPVCRLWARLDGFIDFLGNGYGDTDNWLFKHFQDHRSYARVAKNPENPLGKLPVLLDKQLTYSVSQKTE